jgi:hypothetical protein
VRPHLVSQGIAEVMARVTRMPELEFIPTPDIEPISLNIAYQLRDFLVTEHLKSELLSRVVYGGLTRRLVQYVSRP